MSPDSPVSTATAYELDDRKSIPDRGAISRRAVRVHSLSHPTKTAESAIGCEIKDFQEAL